MKKLLLGLGTIATVVAPISAVVACGETGTDNASIEKIASLKATISKLEKTNKATISKLGKTNKTAKTANDDNKKSIAALEKKITDILEANKEAMISISKNGKNLSSVISFVEANRSTIEKLTIADIKKKTIEDFVVGEIGRVNGVELKKLLDLQQTISKDDAKQKIADLEFTAVEKAWLTQFIEVQDSYIDAWNLITLANASLANAELAAMGWSVAGPFKEISKGNFGSVEAATLYKYIAVGKLTIKACLDGIVEKFSGDDKNFSPAVGIAAMLDKKAHTFTKGPFWSMAMPALGSEEVLKYILSKDASISWTIK